MASPAERAPTGRRPAAPPLDLARVDDDVRREALLALLAGEIVAEARADDDGDEWGRSERFLARAAPLLDFLYDTWFRVEVTGAEHLAATEGGALLVGNHAGAIPPDAPMIAWAVRRETGRPLYLLMERWFRRWPFAESLVVRGGGVLADRDNARRVLAAGNLTLVFPEGIRATGKPYRDRYRLRRFGRGGFVRTALEAGVPIVPVSTVGAEDVFPVLFSLDPVRRLLRLPYFPVTPTWPHLGPLGLVPLPAKFSIEFDEPMDPAAAGLAPDASEAQIQDFAAAVRDRVEAGVKRGLVARRRTWIAPF